MNKAVHVNVHMFVPVIVLGAITGLGGALYNRLCLKAAAFRGKHIKPRPIFFLLEPVLVTVSVHVQYTPHPPQCRKCTCHTHLATVTLAPSLGSVFLFRCFTWRA